MTLSESKSERILGGTFLVVGIVLYFVIIPWQIKDVGAEFPTPRSFPNLLAGILAVLGAVMLCSGYRKKDRPDEATYSMTRAEIGLVLATLGLMTVYVISLYFVPYIPATIVILALMMLIYGQRDPRKLVITSLIVPVAIFLAFTYVLKFKMP